MSGPVLPRSLMRHMASLAVIASPGIQTSPSCNSLRALRTKSARANCTPDHCLPARFNSGIDNTSPTCLPSTSSRAVPDSSSLAGVVAVTACATRWASSTPSGLLQRLTKGRAPLCLILASGRRVAMSRASDRSVLSEKFHRTGSCEVITISRTKLPSIRERVCFQDGPVQTVTGSTRASLPSLGRCLGSQLLQTQRQVLLSPSPAWTSVDETARP